MNHLSPYSFLSTKYTSQHTQQLLVLLHLLRIYRRKPRADRPKFPRHGSGPAGLAALLSTSPSVNMIALFWIQKHFTCSRNNNIRPYYKYLGYTYFQSHYFPSCEQKRESCCMLQHHSAREKTGRRGAEMQGPRLYKTPRRPLHSSSANAHIPHTIPHDLQDDIASPTFIRTACYHPKKKKKTSNIPAVITTQGRSWFHTIQLAICQVRSI